MAVIIDGTTGVSAVQSGAVDLTTDVTGSLPVANGGVGAATLTANAVLLGNGTSALQTVAPSTSGNVLTSNGTTWTSSAPPAGGVTSLNGQSGAITNTDYGAIGSYIIAIYMSSSDIAANTTVSGSTLGRRFDAPSALNIYKDTNMTNANWATLSLSGTWRILTGTNISSYSSSYRGSVLAVRIS